MSDEMLKLPEHYEVERELAEQLSCRVGHQRCVVGHDELLLILHEVPSAGVAEREALFFWRRRDRRWLQPGGLGLDEVDALLERYADAVDRNERSLRGAKLTREVFAVLREAVPLVRSLGNMVEALELGLRQEPDDEDIRRLRDYSKGVERAADLLLIDARDSLAYLQAEAAEEHAESAGRLEGVLLRLNVVTGFFLPLVALASLMGMNVNLPGFVAGSFWVIVVGALLLGAGLLRYLFKKRGSKD